MTQSPILQCFRYGTRRRNEVTAREGIDTRNSDTFHRSNIYGRNEVTAREGIDTNTLSDTNFARMPRRNEVTAREGIDTLANTDRGGVGAP